MRKILLFLLLCVVNINCTYGADTECADDAALDPNQNKCVTECQGAYPLPDNAELGKPKNKDDNTIYCEVIKCKDYFKENDDKTKCVFNTGLKCEAEEYKEILPEHALSGEIKFDKKKNSVYCAIDACESGNSETYDLKNNKCVLVAKADDKCHIDKGNADGKYVTVGHELKCKIDDHGCKNENFTVSADGYSCVTATQA